MNSSNKPYAKFIGFQEDLCIGGFRAYYVIYAKGFERDLSTVFAGTLRELNIPIPVTPEYHDAQKTERWLHKCDTCQITYLNSNPCLDHKRRHTDHNLVSVRVPIIDSEPFEAEESKIYTRDPKTNTLVEDSELKERVKQREQAKKEEPSDFIKNLKKQYPFLNEDTYKGDNL